ncbi:MAG TPA: serine/threonine-protein kinase [Gemmataceae bacterium]|nr:serine/threonine-protein kinase [Gemmataceae bacterium]
MALDASKSSAQTVGNYELVEKIAEGGMGTVYRGRQRETGQVVAIKMVPPNMVHNAVVQKRFENEFKAASSLDHPNIVRALEYGTSAGRSFLVMEFVEGESLGQRLDRERKLPETEAIRIICLAAQGLHHAHKQGLIHRDVKPDNIMVTPDGQVKLADLGLVKEIDADLNLTRTGRGLGTPHFMAPEQFRNAKNADVRCDIYSLGATLYMMVTGELPFRSLGPLDAWMKKVNNDLPPARKLVPELSERVDWAIRRAMSSDPNQRPESCREFVGDLTGQSSPKVKVPEAEGQPQDLWYLAYKDDGGETHTVKGTTTAIRRSLKEGLLGDASNVVACRTKAGPFEPVRSYAEFRDLALSANPPGPRSNQSTTPLQVPGPPTGSEFEGPGSASEVPGRRPTSRGVPRINLEVSGSRTMEWLKLLLIVVVSMGAGMLAFYFFIHK